MWLAAVLFSAVVALPPETPIPCAVCAAGPAVTFAGTVVWVRGSRLRVFNQKTRQSMTFAVPAGFHNVASSDGIITAAPLDRATPGLLTRVTYRRVDGHEIASEVLLLTIEQCRSLEASERLTDSRTDCPD